MKELNEDIIEILESELAVKSNLVRGRMEELEALGKKFHHICVMQCNVGCSKDMEELQDELEQRAEIAVSKIHPELRLYVNTDPRGYPFGLVLPSGRSNNLGGIDWRLDIEE